MARRASRSGFARYLFWLALLANKKKAKSKTPHVNRSREEPLALSVQGVEAWFF
jgi:hypothetical protein